MRLFTNRQARFGVIATRSGADRPDPGAQVCACFSVGANQISAAIAGGCTTVDAVGNTTSAGTNCGSCKAEIRAMLAVLSTIELRENNRVLAAE
jgi:assimilatory nitrate reductase catalytic subunit